jgi:hypothetical protein
LSNFSFSPALLAFFDSEFFVISGRSKMYCVKLAALLCEKSGNLSAKDEYKLTQTPEKLASHVQFGRHWAVGALASHVAMRPRCSRGF